MVMMQNLNYLHKVIKYAFARCFDSPLVAQIYKSREHALFSTLTVLLFNTYYVDKATHK